MRFSPAGDVTQCPVGNHIIWRWQTSWDDILCDGGWAERSTANVTSTTLWEAPPFTEDHPQPRYAPQRPNNSLGQYLFILLMQNSRENLSFSQCPTVSSELKSQLYGRGCMSSCVCPFRNQMHTCAYAQRGHGSISGVFLSCSSPQFWRQSLSQNLDFIESVRLSVISRSPPVSRSPALATVLGLPSCPAFDIMLGI